MISRNSHLYVEDEESFATTKMAGKEVITKTCIRIYALVYSFCEIDSLNSFIRRRCVFVFVPFTQRIRIGIASRKNVDGFYSLSLSNAPKIA